MHDEFVQLLVTGLKQLPAAVQESDPEVRAVAANYHRKLQAFLLSSVDYHPNRLIYSGVSSSLFGFLFYPFLLIFCLHTQSDQAVAEVVPA